MHNQARAILKTQFDTNAAHEHDRAYREKVNKDLQTFGDKYYMQDLSTPQTQSDI